MRQAAQYVPALWQVRATASLVWPGNYSETLWLFARILSPLRSYQNLCDRSQQQNSVPVVAGEVARTCKSVCIISRSLASCLLLFRSSSPFIFIFFPRRPVSFSIVPRISVHRTCVPVSSPFFVSVTMSIVSTFSIASVSLSVPLPWFLSSKLFFSKLSHKESYQNRRIDTLSL